MIDLCNLIINISVIIFILITQIYVNIWDWLFNEYIIFILGPVAVADLARIFPWAGMQRKSVYCLNF